MILRKSSVATGLLLLLPWLFALGCHSEATSPQVTHASQGPDGNSRSGSADTSAASQRIQAIASSGSLATLHAPNFSDYQKLVQTFYQSANFAPAWLHNGQPAAPALAVIAALENSRQKGPES
ncbi:hypothetical protein [Acidisarcina polymorpha]|uniref:hypothetical protein n=1 Tax=Acidisarcina polymorpha TaxID=2211140 RepID=UPI0013752A56|nr:hypothetical protein [Acidisarcina polymorpha]